MKNYLLVIEYDGTAYNGWQKQGNTSNTIQAIMEENISKILGESINLHGSGRTDAGVHAKGQRANFKCSSDIELESFLQKLNLQLPSDIKVAKIKEVDAKFHSRLSAISKIYSYHISYGDKPSVFKRKYVYHCETKPDINLMKKAAKYLIGTHDFRGFSSEKRLDKSCVREMYEINITQDKGGIIISFHGNGFLYNMVRILAGTLLDIGIGTLSIDDLIKALSNSKREYAGKMLPPNGLFLEQVFY